MRSAKKLFGLLLAMGLLMVGCAPTTTATPSPTPITVSEDARPIYSDVQQDLAIRAEVETEDVELVEFERVQWPDAGLGCPHPDTVYAQVITPGYRFVLEAEGETYEYHVADEGFFVFCEEGLPQEPMIEATDPS
ncbi:MAG: hypothetical protein ACLFWD_11320 [Anaerolineales bacterium]